MRIPHSPAREDIADKITLIAQKYAGYFVGHPYRHDQQRVNVIQTDPERGGIHIENKEWKEPVILSDDCDFCQRLTDESAEQRIAGFQHQIDIEVLRGKSRHYSKWLSEHPEQAIETQVEHYSDGTERTVGMYNSAANRRRFCELFQDVPRTTGAGQPRPTGWKQKPFPMVALPLRIKRKICIEWNHIYRDYLKANPSITYDFDRKLFFKDLPDLEPCNVCGGKAFYDPSGIPIALHSPTCVKVDDVFADVTPGSIVNVTGPYFNNNVRPSDRDDILLGVVLF